MSESGVLFDLCDRGLPFILSFVNPKLFHRSAVAFFDQFISRGAEEDVRDLRDKLVNDESTRNALLSQLPANGSDERAAFEAFRRFLEAQAGARRQGPTVGPDLAEMVGWMQYGWGDGETTADPAQWHDWLASCEVARRPA